MPPHDLDRPADPDPPRLPFGWGAEPEPAPEPEAVAELDSDPDVVPVVMPIKLLWCWRCGETAEPVAGKCPWCGTWTDGKAPPRARPVKDEDDEDEWEDDWHTDAAKPVRAVPVAQPPLIPHIIIVVVAYVGLLGTLVGCAVLAALRGVSSPEEVLEAQAFAEVVSTLLTLVALALVWSSARQRVPAGTTALTWLVSMPVLFVLLCVNLAFFTFLRELFKPMGVPEAERIQVTLATVLLICVQPAIVEELFFRQMTLGVLRKSMNLHLAVWITAAAFAAAHLGNILGMPYLFLVGGFLGYARVYGGLPLAMVLHFIHNFVVIGYDAWVRP